MRFRLFWNNATYRWMVSRQAAYLFGFALVLVLLGTVFLLNAFAVFDGSDGLFSNLFWGTFGVMTPLGFCFLLSGMHKFEDMRKVRFGDSDGGSKFASLALRFGLGWGAMVYFFVVYLPIVRTTFTSESIGEHVS